MTSRPSAFVRFVGDLRRRRVFATAGLYIVGAWLVMQAADVFFPGWGIPDKGINVLLGAAVIGFPLALVFGWFFNITSHGIRRTLPATPDRAREPRPLTRNDYLVLGALVLVAVVVVSYAANRILALPRTDAAEFDARLELTPRDKPPNSVAVLPFDNISTDPENEVFSDGVSEEIRNRLGQHGELQVIARTSSFQFKGSDHGIPRISELLGVRYLLKGSVRREGDRIRVSAQLVAEEGTQLWTRNYDRVLADIFAIQDEIADLVAAEVAPQIAVDSGGGYKPSLDAYQHFVAGRHLFYKRHYQAAREELALAIELDPDYAEAHAEYAISLLIPHPDEQALRKADAAITKALDLSPDLPRVWAARGLFFKNAQPHPDPVASEAALREALRGDPNMADAMNWLSGTLSFQGKEKEAQEWLERAYARDPFNGVVATNMATRVWEGGSPERAERILHRQAGLPDPNLLAIYMLGEFYSDTGRLIDANRTAKRLMLAGEWRPYALAASYAMMGQFEVAADWISAAVREYPEERFVRNGWLQGYVPYWRGDYRQAVEAMRRAGDANGISLAQLPASARSFMANNLALAGDHSEAIEMLAEWLPSDADAHSAALYGADTYQSLAWAYSQTGMPDMARERLEIVEQWFAQHSASVETLKSGDLYDAARNAVLLGDRELALDRLEQAVAAGWRGYYINRHDPRWGALRGDPRYQTLMAQVKADVDRQRAVVEKIDAEEDFQAVLDKVRESRNPTAEESAGGR